MMPLFQEVRQLTSPPPLALVWPHLSTKPITKRQMGSKVFHHTGLWSFICRHALLAQGGQTFSVKGQTAYTLGFVAYDCVTKYSKHATECKTAIGNTLINQHGYIPIKLCIFPIIF